MNVPLNAYDCHMFARSITVGIAMAGLGLGVMQATDGAMTSSAEKVARLCVMAPIFGACAAYLAAIQGRRSGEELALRSIGQSPRQICKGALLGAGLMGLLGAVAIALGWGDPSGLFPRIDSAGWIAGAGHVWSAPERGVVLTEPSSAPIFTQPLGMRETSNAHTSEAVAAAVAVASLWVPSWIVQPMRAWEKLGVGLMTLACTVMLFHWIAAGRAPIWCLILVPVPLAIHDRIRRASERTDVAPAS